jgi:hypothetical protein
MPGRGLPANVLSQDWRDWLRAFPPSPDQGLGNAMAHRSSLRRHLENMPALEQLDPSEKIRVGDDLAHYARILQGSQKTSLRDSWASLGGAGVGIGISLWIPGAQIVGACIGAGFMVVAMARTYDVKRREAIIEELVARVDELSWELKGR